MKNRLSINFLYEQNQLSEQLINTMVSVRRMDVADLSNQHQKFDQEFASLPVNAQVRLQQMSHPKRRYQATLARTLLADHMYYLQTLGLCKAFTKEGEALLADTLKAPNAQMRPYFLQDFIAQWIERAPDSPLLLTQYASSQDGESQQLVHVEQSNIKHEGLKQLLRHTHFQSSLSHCDHAIAVTGGYEPSHAFVDVETIDTKKPADKLIKLLTYIADELVMSFFKTYTQEHSEDDSRKLFYALWGLYECCVKANTRYKEQTQKAATDERFVLRINHEGMPVALDTLTGVEALGMFRVLSASQACNEDQDDKSCRDDETLIMVSAMGFSDFSDSHPKPLQSLLLHELM